MIEKAKRRITPFKRPKSSKKYLRLRAGFFGLLRGISPKRSFKKEGIPDSTPAGAQLSYAHRLAGRGQFFLFSTAIPLKDLKGFPLL
ncbi:MAG: hypothetical protein ACUVXI_15400 [bacterium]